MTNYENRKLKIIFDEKSNEINIYGNKNGLMFLSDICKKIISKHGEHYHFAYWSGECNIMDDSKGLILWYVDDIDNSGNLIRKSEKDKNKESKEGGSI